MATAHTTYPWEEAAQRAGMDSARRLNAAAIPLPGSRALLWQRTDGRSEVWSGADLQRRGRELAAALAAAGLRQGDRVAGVVGRRPDAFAVPLAVWQLGGVYVPLFTGFGSEAVAVRVEDSGASTLVVDDDNVDAAVQTRQRLDELRLISLDSHHDGVDMTIADLLARAPAEQSLAPTRRDDTATIMYTSGTSGKPKGCMIPHYGAVTLWPFVEHCLGLGAGDTLFSTADAGWSFGLYTTGFAPMSCGVTRVLYEGGFDAGEWWRVVADTGAENFASAPTGYRQLAIEGESAMPPEAPRLASATSCGEPLTREVVEWFREHLGVVIHDSYGATEVGILLADLRTLPKARPGRGALGQVLPGFAIRLVDDDLREVPLGEPGRVAVRDSGWLLSRGYWERPEAWNVHLHGGWWVTEDVVRCDGVDYWYVGRSDDVIVTAGYNVGPADVEQVLLDHPAIADAACVGESDSRKGQVVSAHVVLALDEADQSELLEELRAAVGERIGWHAAPRHLHVRGALPRTESGKVRRRELREHQGAAH